MSEIPEYYGVQIRGYHGANWFTSRGVYLKRREIEKKGLPVLKRCKFLTLTVDGHGYISERKAYELGKERMRRFLAKLRSVIGPFAWAWKLEFHEDGYPHWHLIIDYRKMIPPDFLDRFTDWWGLGRVNVAGIKQKRFQYLFKYVSKMASGDCDPDAEIDLPSWVLDYFKILADGRRSAGIRFWQTGGGFYTMVKAAPAKPKKEKRSSRLPLTIRQRWEMWKRKATVFVRGMHGDIRCSRQILFRQPYHEVICQVIRAFVDGKAAHVPNVLGFMCGLSIISNQIDEWILNKIKQMAVYRSRTEMVFLSVD
ncbi:MAG: rolling circle replication-associated protein [Puniceicoccales bacterium]